MSYNMIDLTLFDKIDCAVESYYHRTFASYHRYRISNISLSNHFHVELELIHQDGESNDPTLAEVVISKICKLDYQNHYGSDPFDKFHKAVDAILGSYYLVQIEDHDIVLLAKHKGKIPNLVTPALHIITQSGVSFDLTVDTYGTDTDIFVPNDKRNQLHLPKTTQGPDYQTPTVGDRIIVIDSVESQRDRTFTRKIIDVKENAACTCDVLYIDQPIDRLETNHRRINGIALHKPTQNINNYTAKFYKTKLYKRKTDYLDILRDRGTVQNVCAVPIDDHFNMQSVAVDICKEFIQKSQNPHLASMNYFGGSFNWRMFETQLSPIYEKFGQWLCDDLFLLTSNRYRPEYLVHIDYHHVETDTPVVGSLTWPVMNCNENTVTVWYDCFLNDQKIYSYGKQDVVITDPNIKLVEIDRYYFNTDAFNAVILKHDDWHTLYNYDEVEENRMLLQWRFRPNISWQQILELTEWLHKIKN